MKTRSCLLLLAVLGGMTLSSPLGAADFVFYWNASADLSVTAYGIYQRSGDSPYANIGEVPVEDLDDPNRPSYRVTGLSDGNRYWFAATAISVSGTESDFSSQTCITVNGQVVECTDNDEDGAAVYVSCFIRATGVGSFSESHGPLSGTESNAKDHIRPRISAVKPL